MPALSASALAAYAGRRGAYFPDAKVGLGFTVKVLDAKQSYGRLMLKVAPVAGVGERWVNDDSVKLEEVTPETDHEAHVKAIL